MEMARLLGEMAAELRILYHSLPKGQRERERVEEVLRKYDAWLDSPTGRERD